MVNNEKIELLEEFLEEDFSATILVRGKATRSKIVGNLIIKNDCIKAKVYGSGAEIYDVELIFEPAMVNASCTCYYFENERDNCKHIAAVTYKFIEHLKSDRQQKPYVGVTSILDNLPTNLKKTIVLPVKNQPNVEQQFQWIEDKLPNVWDLRYKVNNKEFKAIDAIFSRSYWWGFKTLDQGKKFEISKDAIKAWVEKTPDKNELTIACNCGKITSNKLCEHIWGLLCHISNQKSAHYFRQFYNLDDKKEKLLSAFGINLTDDLAKEFKYDFDYNGNLIIAEKPLGFLPTFEKHEGDWKFVTSKFSIKKSTVPPAIANTDDKKTKTKPPEPFDAAILLNLNQNALNGLRIDGIRVTQKGSNIGYAHQRLRTKNDLDMFNNAPANLKQALFDTIDDNLIYMLSQKGDAQIANSSQPFRSLTQRQLDDISYQYEAAFRQMANQLPEWQHLYYLPEGNNFTKKMVTHCRFINTELSCQLQLSQSDTIVSLKVQLTNPDSKEIIEGYTTHKFLLKHNHDFYLQPKALEGIRKYLPSGRLMAPLKNKQQFVQQIILPLSTKFTIDMGDVLKIQNIEEAPQPRVYLSELNEKYLMLTPKWVYGNVEVDNDKDDTTTIEHEDGLLTIKRDSIEEGQLVKALRELHPTFQHQNNEYFYLHFDDVMKGNWFLKMYQQLQEMDIPLFGMNTLQRFKYNVNSPSLSFNTGSGTDWFDVQMEVNYGEQVLPLAALRKAILNKQQFVLLGDGTLGMLPQEWIDRFSLLLRMGTVKGDHLQVSKLHWTIIDQLHDNITAEDILQELALKKTKLKDIENIKKAALPKTIKATLRDYQKAGFQWMQLMDQMGWGGCLADDMGLGKTLQTLCFLAAVQQTKPLETHLIVCPTSLIYNWENEIKKFTPHLRFHVYYGVGREWNDHDIDNADIMITSYGVVRSDIELFTKHQFGYIILDESQAIKNPASQTAKAVGLLKSRNRFILSGTPVQNNTFDLYAQFNFINPGLLGNMEFFRTNFANPIDKENDRNKSEQLRKLIYPFMLRRTKEQVAKDLPSKTESILWCEMEPKQRTIYNSFKEHYRKSIMKKIEEDGFANASIFILSGLTKLRQICDSPAILNEAEAYPNVSIKIDELMREIEENSGNHKALIFSQFTSMLHLIETELKQKGINYYYLDGSTKAAERKDLVANFQANDEVRFFLISLKAGGVGLNLTAADYVYLVDPWWNPAAEQQAIDRTHRIGQQKSVFAYKLICKDTIEEKILQLQQNKKALSADLISDENGFVKKLTKADVKYLFD